MVDLALCFSVLSRRLPRASVFRPPWYACHANFSEPLDLHLVIVFLAVDPFLWVVGAVLLRRLPVGASTRGRRHSTGRKLRNDLCSKTYWRARETYFEI